MEWVLPFQVEVMGLTPAGGRCPHKFQGANITQIAPYFGHSRNHSSLHTFKAYKLSAFSNWFRYQQN